MTKRYWSGITGAEVLVQRPALTLLVLSKCDVFLIGGVQNPEDRLQVGVVEQVRPRDAALLENLQLLQKKLSGLL